MLKRRIKGLFVNPEVVAQALAPKADGRRPAVLDIGSGSGVWAAEVAKQFPGADVLGIDIVLPHLATYVHLCSFPFPTRLNHLP